MRAHTVPSVPIAVFVSCALAAVGGLFAIAPSGGRALEHECNLAGDWTGTGVDVQHTSWTFTLALRQRGTSLEGRFQWHGSTGTDGEERVRGSVDCGARRIRMQGYAVNSPRLAQARYTLSTSAWFNAIWGNWTGGIPGSLRGRKTPPLRPGPSAAP